MKLKIAVAFSLLFFFIITTSVLVGYIVVGEINKSTVPVYDKVKEATIIKDETVTDSSEVSKHNNIDDCWLIISGNIYNVTTYLNLHPGGISEIQPYCGKEATQAFQSRGGDGMHTSFAISLLDNYIIGPLGTTLTNTTTTNISIQVPGSEKTEEDDDD